VKVERKPDEQFLAERALPHGSPDTDTSTVEHA